MTEETRGNIRSSNWKRFWKSFKMLTGHSWILIDSLDKNKLSFKNTKEINHKNKINKFLSKMIIFGSSVVCIDSFFLKQNNVTIRSLILSSFALLVLAIKIRFQLNILTVPVFLEIAFEFKISLVDQGTDWLLEFLAELDFLLANQCIHVLLDAFLFLKSLAYFLSPFFVVGFATLLLDNNCIIFINGNV